MCTVNVNLGIFNLVGYKSDRMMFNEIKDDKKGQIIKPYMTQFRGRVQPEIFTTELRNGITLL